MLTLKEVLMLFYLATLPGWMLIATFLFKR